MAAEAVDIDSAHFLKMVKDCGLVDVVSHAAGAPPTKVAGQAGLTAIEADLIFLKAKRFRTDRRLHFNDFRAKAVPAIAAAKRMTVDDCVSALTLAAPSNHDGTVAEPNRFHDDPSHYTGKSLCLPSTVCPQLTRRPVALHR